MFALTESTPGSVFISTSTSTVSRWGWVAGFGAETKIGHSNWLGRIEYLHYDFGTSGNGSETFAGGGFSQTSADTTGRLTADVVRAGISYLLP
jgi:outer membrane immunogenic protein